MSQPIYTPTFQHKDWIDFVDSVQAGGANGINIRFHGIEAEFTAIQAALNLLSQPPSAVPQTMTLAPTLTATTNPPWSQFLGFVQTPTVGSPPSGFAASAFGFMPVNLPDGSIVQSLRVTGVSAGGNLTVNLASQPIAGGAETSVLQVVATLPSFSPAAAFDVPPTPQNANVVVDNKSNKYFLIAILAAGNTALNGNGTSLYSFQIGYSVA